MRKLFQIKHAIIGSLIAVISFGCASNGQVYTIEDHLNNQGVHIREIHEKSYVLQMQIENQRDQMDNMSCMIQRLEQKLYGVRFRITPIVIQILHDYDELEKRNKASRDYNICTDVVLPISVDQAYN